MALLSKIPELESEAQYCGHYWYIAGRDVMCETVERQHRAATTE